MKELPCYKCLCSAVCISIVCKLVSEEEDPTFENGDECPDEFIEGVIDGVLTYRCSDINDYLSFRKYPTDKRGFLDSRDAKLQQERSDRAKSYFGIHSDIPWFKTLMFPPGMEADPEDPEASYNELVKYNRELNLKYNP